MVNIRDFQSFDEGSIPSTCSYGWSSNDKTVGGNLINVGSLPTLLAMTISFTPIWIPVIAQLLVVVGCVISIYYQEMNWFTGFLEVVTFLILTPFIWLLYFAIMYFTMK